MCVHVARGVPSTFVTGVKIVGKSCERRSAVVVGSINVGVLG